MEIKYGILSILCDVEIKLILRNMKILAVTLLSLLILTTCSGCLIRQDTELGNLEGRVTIGPICPVERLDLPCAIPQEAYETRKIRVFREDGKTLVKTVDINPAGHYRAELRPGRYTIDIIHTGIDRSAEVPALVEIQPGKTVILDIAIDTGITGHNNGTGSGQTQLPQFIGID